MVEANWPDLRGKELRYGDETWELTGAVNVRGSGESLEVSAKQLDDVKGSTATIRFNVRDPPVSLNPGNLGVYSTSLERADGQYYIVVEMDSRTYRYEIASIQYD